jgi:hypothetical protein
MALQAAGEARNRKAIPRVGFDHLFRYISLVPLFGRKQLLGIQGGKSLLPTEAV